jgi:2-dehydropantoate 2-reductase
MRIMQNLPAPAGMPTGCIFGAGAVGSHFAVRLALAGHEVSCVMRGPHLAAVKAKGLTLRVGDAEFSAKVQASDDPAALGPQDVVISTLKATGLSSLATGLRPLLRDDTAVVFAQNGIPWWYDIGLSSDHPPPPDLGFLDPGGRCARLVAGADHRRRDLFVERDCRARRGRQSVARSQHAADRRMRRPPEPADRTAARGLLDAASIQSPPTPRIRETIWSKL